METVAIFLSLDQVAAATAAAQGGAVSPGHQVVSAALSACAGNTANLNPRYSPCQEGRPRALILRVLIPAPSSVQLPVPVLRWAEGFAYSQPKHRICPQRNKTITQCHSNTKSPMWGLTALDGASSCQALSAALPGCQSSLCPSPRAAGETPAHLISGKRQHFRLSWVLYLLRSQASY